MTAVLFDGFRETRLGPGVHRVGRDATRCDVVFQDDQLSRLHACFIGQPGRPWTLLDMRSTNGIQVNGTPARYRHLEDFDAVQLGRTRLVFYEVARPDEVMPPLWEAPPNRALDPALNPALFEEHLAPAAVRRDTFARLVAVQAAGMRLLETARGPGLTGRIRRLAGRVMAARWAYLVPWPAGADPAAFPAALTPAVTAAAETGEARLTRRVSPGAGALGEIGSGVAAPLRPGGVTAAVVVVANPPGEHRFDEDDRLQLARFARFATAAMAAADGPPGDAAAGPGAGDGPSD